MVCPDHLNLAFKRKPGFLGDRPLPESHASPFVSGVFDQPCARPMVLNMVFPASNI